MVGATGEVRVKGFFRFHANVNGKVFDYQGNDKAEFERTQTAAMDAIIDDAVVKVTGGKPYRDPKRGSKRRAAARQEGT